ncbi:MAG: ABC transporter ATP-binding protein [Myxococcota bacterium]
MTTPAIELINVSKHFRHEWTFRKKSIVHDLSFAAFEGETFGFIGQNGAGKTTTIKMLLDLIRPSSGQILLLGKPPGKPNARADIGFMPERPYFYEYLTAHETMMLYAGLKHLSHFDAKRQSEELLERVDLQQTKRKKLRDFSKGMLQRLALAQALLGNPKLVIMDEPMSGLDPVGRKLVRDIMLWLKERKTSIFFSTHILTDVEAICDRVAMIHNGQLKMVGHISDFVSSGTGSLEDEFIKRTKEDLP